jgi:uncharacterized protein YjbI with pentapeptide repeats
LVGEHWKALIGWRALVDYINPKNATGRKDAVQVYALIVAGVVAAITAAVGLLNLRLTRKNLELQRELEEQRGQGTALQAYYEQIGKLLTEYEIHDPEKEQIRQLARGQTLTVLQDLDAGRKRSLLAFLHGAGLIERKNPAVELTDADLRGADLQEADLQEANFQGARLLGANLQNVSYRRANFRGAYLQGAILQGAWVRETRLLGSSTLGLIFSTLGLIRTGRVDLRGAHLQNADLLGANLQNARLEGASLLGADFGGADLSEANLRKAIAATPQQLYRAESLEGATMPDGRRPEDWVKDKEWEDARYEDWLKKKAVGRTWRTNKPRSGGPTPQEGP